MQAARGTFSDVFAVSEFRALWLAQLLSVAGDQLARVALTVLVYDRTRSAFLAAVTFVASVVPTFIGGIALAGLADRFPRRQVMITCDLIRCVLVLIMAIPGMPLTLLVVLLFLVTLVGAPFTSARAAIYPDVLTGDSYVMGTAVTLTTNQFAQVIGFATGGAIVGFFGTRTSLVLDAVTFTASAVIVRVWVRSRPAPAAATDGSPAPREGFLAAALLVFGNPALRLPMFFGWLAAFYNAPEGVVAPLARSLGGGSVVIGVILAAQAFGETVGTIVFSRFVSPPARLRSMGPLAVFACVILVAFAVQPGLYPSLLLLAASGACASYQIGANAAFVTAAPQRQRSQAFGLAQGGMSLGQGTTMLLAGAGAEHAAPARVIALFGALGAILAFAIALSWARSRSGRRRDTRIATLPVSRLFSPSCRRAWRSPSLSLSPRMFSYISSAPAVAAHGALLHA
ncbi:MAG: MFS transporter [Streptosporangiaceae bacterium]|nr:MFS transporter [Streptosporangiaceae bacterium]MBV9856281.1 MFS transporter [Streptosporangiaceae bacterium]